MSMKNRGIWHACSFYMHFSDTGIQQGVFMINYLYRYLPLFLRAQSAEEEARNLKEVGPWNSICSISGSAA